jgi:Carboxypeptidase regulatory-like domain
MATGKLFRTAVRMAIALAIGSAAASEIQAEAGTGTIAGLVRDSSGAAVPGATVRVVNEGNGVTREIVTNEQGSYRADALPPGLYRVETTLDGFETPARHVAVEANQILTLDVTLTPSRLSEAVLVTARRIEEVAQEVPIPVSVVSGRIADDRSSPDRTAAFGARPTEIFRGRR